MLHVPTAPRDTAPSTTMERVLHGLSGRVVGFIDNAKPNFNHLADDLGRILMDRHGVQSVLMRRKRAASVPASGAVYDEMARECDLIITGSGD